MKASAPLACRLAAGLCGLGGLAVAATGAAQGVPGAGAGTPGPAPAYHDRYIAGGTLPPDISAGEFAAEGSLAGLARSIELDGVVASIHSASGDLHDSYTEQGFILRSQWETMAYGAWSLEASMPVRGAEPGQPSTGDAVATLRQRGMPFDGGWQADNALGDLNSPQLALARLQPRFYLPTTPMQGLSTEWRGSQGLQLVAGGGEPGMFSGLAVPGFRTLGGSTATLGAEWSPASHWTLGSQLVSAHDVNLAAGSLVETGGRLSSATGLVAAQWEDRGRRLQFNVVDGGVSGGPSGTGAWVDGQITDGRVIQNAGIFRIDPNLTWGSQLISNDAEGGYYRYGYHSRRWFADAGLDAVRSVSGRGTDTIFLTADARYQVSRDWGVGGVTNLSHTHAGDAWSVEGYLDHVNRLGISRMQANVTEAPGAHDTQLTLDQNWTTLSGVRLSTGASVERASGVLYGGVAQDSTVVGLNVYGGGDLTARLGFDANVRWTTAIQGRAAPGVSATVSLVMQLTNAWQLLATYYDTQIGAWTPLQVQSPLTPPAFLAVPAVQERGAFLTFRYQRAAGSRFAPLGGMPGSGSGALAGVVYLDANDNGRRDAGEVGAANVTVVLDGRFSVQTDAEGRFQFPAVAAGHHVLTVVSDNVPLPWLLPNEGREDVDVSTRGSAFVAIGAQRMR